MPRFSRASAVVALLVSAACSRQPVASPDPPSAADAGSVVIDSSVLDSSPPASGAVGESSSRGASPAALTAALTAAPVHGKSIGHTSVVFKLGLSTGSDAAYKPRSHRGGERFRGEIAAFRLATIWVLPNVPTAVARSFAGDGLRAALDDKGAALYDAEVIAESDGTVRGALIPWIPKLEFLQLESGAPRAQWAAWLDDPNDAAAPSPGCDADLASQISTMILFDTMSGNWDRWSGGNIGVTRGTGGACDRVLFIDNDGAFFDPVPAAAAAAQLALVKKMNRFSKSFVIALRATSEPDLVTALGEELPGKPLLPKHAVDAFFARRKTVLAAIDGKVAANGEAKTLALP